MTTRRSVLAHSAALLAASFALPRSAFAQAFPSKPIKVIVPFPAGGPADSAVRIAQPGMDKILGQSVIVENVVGAAGQIGAQRVRQAAPDGYTLLQAASPHTTNAAARPATNIDIRRDFIPIGVTGNSVYALCASKSSGIKTLAELIARAKAKPGELKIGSVGVGSTHHLIAEALKAAASVDITHIPYRGEAPAIPDLVAGRIDVMFLVTAKPLIDGGQAVGIAVSSAEPWFNLPGIKPFTELGYKDLVFYGWNGLMAPKGTPSAVAAKLSGALAAALNSDASVRAFNAMGFKPGSGTPDAMAAQIERDMDVFTRVIRERQLKFES
ncbi:MAG: tripartite tricarboxylate transporter substrate binding protein [Xanthobacteraceae bacterium]